MSDHRKAVSERDRDRDYEALFESLPQNKLSPLEVPLRKALLDWLEQGHGPLPIIQWIDRRIGGEIETKRTEHGYELLIRPEAFFATLPADSLSVNEVALQKACLEFLACWTSQELADHKAMSVYPKVKSCRVFIPSHISLKEWVESRIGGFIEFRDDGKGNHVVHLTPAGRPIVTEIFERLAKEAKEERSRGSRGRAPTNNGHGHTTSSTTRHDDRGRGRDSSRNASGGRRDRSRDRGGARSRGAASDRVDRHAESTEVNRHDERTEAWFAELPTDNLSRPEALLRQALLSFLKHWQHGRPPSLEDASQDGAILPLRQALIPETITLRDWIERRIGGELDVKKGERSGSYELSLQDVAAPVETSRGKKEKPAKEKATGPSEEAEDFLAVLPADQLSPDEARLRLALLHVLEAQASGQQPLFLSDVSQDCSISKCCSAFLPPEVSLRLWLDRRIGGEVETSKDPQGRTVIQLRRTSSSEKAPDDSRSRGELNNDSEEGAGAVPAVVVAAQSRSRGGRREEPQRKRGREEPPPDAAVREKSQQHLDTNHADAAVASADDDAEPRSAEPDVGGGGSQRGADEPAHDSEKDQFFQRFPEDGFEPDEERLREALLAFLGHWVQSKPPTLSNLGSDSEVRKHRALVLPKDAPVSLQEWIDRRMGGEIDMEMDPTSGQWIVGLMGKLDKSSISRARKGDGGVPSRTSHTLPPARAERERDAVGGNARGGPESQSHYKRSRVAEPPSLSHRDRGNRQRR